MRNEAAIYLTPPKAEGENKYIEKSVWMIHNDRSVT